MDLNLSCWSCKPDTSLIPCIYIQLAINVCVSFRFRFHHFTPRMPQKHTKTLNSSREQTTRLLPLRNRNCVLCEGDQISWICSARLLNDRPRAPNLATKLEKLESTCKLWNPSALLKIWNGGNAPVPDVALFFPKSPATKTIYVKKNKLPTMGSPTPWISSINPSAKMHFRTSQGIHRGVVSMWLLSKWQHTLDRQSLGVEVSLMEVMLQKPLAIPQKLEFGIQNWQAVSQADESTNIITRSIYRTFRMSRTIYFPTSQHIHSIPRSLLLRIAKTWDAHSHQAQEHTPFHKTQDFKNHSKETWLNWNTMSSKKPSYVTSYKVI